MRLTSGSSMARGRSVRTLVTASLTSLSARSALTSSQNSIAVLDVPSVTVDWMCLTPAMPETESSILRVTCVSSSDGAAPDWVTLTETTGTSMLGNLVIGRLLNDTQPSATNTTNSTIDGTGYRIDRAETLKDIGALLSPSARPA